MEVVKITFGIVVVMIGVVAVLTAMQWLRYRHWHEWRIEREVLQVNYRGKATLVQKKSCSCGRAKVIAL